MSHAVIIENGVQAAGHEGISVLVIDDEDDDKDDKNEDTNVPNPQQATVFANPQNLLRFPCKNSILANISQQVGSGTDSGICGFTIWKEDDFKKFARLKIQTMIAEGRLLPGRYDATVNIIASNLKRQWLYLRTRRHNALFRLQFLLQCESLVKSQLSETGHHILVAAILKEQEIFERWQQTISKTASVLENREISAFVEKYLKQSPLSLGKIDDQTVLQWITSKLDALGTTSMFSTGNQSTKPNKQRPSSSSGVLNMGNPVPSLSSPGPSSDSKILSSDSQKGYGHRPNRIPPRDKDAPKAPFRRRRKAGRQKAASIFKPTLRLSD